jgi:ribosomal protein L7/L12
MVILGDITKSYDDLSMRHSRVLQMVLDAPSRDGKQNYRDAISKHCIYEDAHKIPLIKMIRGEFGMGLKEAKELIEDLCEFDSDWKLTNLKEEPDESQEIS